MNRAEMITQARLDLDQVHDRLLWAHTDAHYKANATPTRNRSAAPMTDPDPDHVRAPRFDIGIGNHRARQAWNAAIGQLAQAELRLQVAAYLAAPGWQPLAVRPDWTATPAKVTLCVTGCRRRLVILSAAGESGQADRLLEQACRNLDLAWRSLAQLDKGATGGEATAEPMCRICTIRPAAERKGGRCETCAAWHRRNGYERPRSLDQDAVGEARAAKARRQHRGEGWGDEGYSAVGRWPELDEQVKVQREKVEKANDKIKRVGGSAS